MSDNKIITHQTAEAPEAPEAPVTPEASPTPKEPLLSPERKTEPEPRLLKKKPKKLSKPRLRLRVPPQARVISRHLSTWLVIAGLVAVTVETIYIFNRGPDPHLQQLVRQRYQVPTAQFNQDAINRLNNLQPPAPVPAASGKPNPFVP